LPYALTSFEVQAHAQITAEGIESGKDEKPVRQVLSLPTDAEVVKFPAAEEHP